MTRIGFTSHSEGMHKRRHIARAFVGLLVLAAPFTISAQRIVEPGNASRGENLFREKGCVQCHAFNGQGGKAAPDLSQRPHQSETPAQLASQLWNHSPKMWAVIKSTGSKTPALDSFDAADLFAYFYSRLYFDAEGEAARGRVVFESKKCIACHALNSGNKRGIGPAVDRWDRVSEPIEWSERMWNHSAEMMAEIRKIGATWPLVTAAEMMDLIAYIRSLPAARSQAAAFRSGNPEAGRVTFEGACESCHSFGSQPRKVDLLGRTKPTTLGGYIASMWNHAPVMVQGSGGEPPKLARGQMRDLLAYMFAKRYFEERGDSKTGASVYVQKNCAYCHENHRRESGAVDLVNSAERFSPITMASAAWKHRAGAEFLEKEKLGWPTLSASEMTDLIAFLNSRIAIRIGL